MGNVFFDNDFSDMEMHDEIKQSECPCEQEATVARACGYCQREIVPAHLEAKEASDRLENCRRQLHRLRQEAFERAAELPAYEQSTAYQQN